MKLEFVDFVSMMDAKAACSGDKGGRIITSHSGCNKDGERAVYKWVYYACSLAAFLINLG